MGWCCACQWWRVSSGQGAVAAKRQNGQRGVQRSPVKHLVSVRHRPEVLAHFKSEGADWQTRMDDALKQWVAAQTSKSEYSQGKS